MNKKVLLLPIIGTLSILLNSCGNIANKKIEGFKNDAAMHFYNGVEYKSSSQIFDNVNIVGDYYQDENEVYRSFYDNSKTIKSKSLEEKAIGPVVYYESDFNYYDALGNKFNYNVEMPKLIWQDSYTYLVSENSKIYNKITKTPSKSNKIHIVDVIRAYYSTDFFFFKLREDTHYSFENAFSLEDLNSLKGDDFLKEKSLLKIDSKILKHSDTLYSIDYEYNTKYYYPIDYNSSVKSLSNVKEITVRKNSSEKVLLALHLKGQSSIYKYTLEEVTTTNSFYDVFYEGKYYNCVIEFNDEIKKANYIPLAYKTAPDSKNILILCKKIVNHKPTGNNYTILINNNGTTTDFVDDEQFIVDNNCYFLNRLIPLKNKKVISLTNDYFIYKHKNELTIVYKNKNYIKRDYDIYPSNDYFIDDKFFIADKYSKELYSNPKFTSKCKYEGNLFNFEFGLYSVGSNLFLNHEFLLNTNLSKVFKSTTLEYKIADKCVKIGYFVFINKTLVVKLNNK